MSLFDKVLDVYYDVKFKVEDAVDNIKFKLYNVIHGVSVVSDEELIKTSKKVSKKKAKSKKKKK